VRHALAELLAAPPVNALSRADQATVELVLAEVLNNVAEHAYAGASGTVTVDLAPAPGGLACLVFDAGDPMPGDRLPEGRLWADRGTALADLPEGGFGWSLIRSLTRDLSYQRRRDQNRLTFVIPLAG
jgi:serine/threonine-protein kinase RsbW